MPTGRSVRHEMAQAIRKDASPQSSGTARGDKMDFAARNCESTNLKKVSLAYQEGVYHIDTRRSSRTSVCGGGPGVLWEELPTRGSQHTALQSVFALPQSGRMQTCFVVGSRDSSCPLLYAQHVMSSPPPVSSLPVKAGTRYFAQLSFFSS